MSGAGVRTRSFRTSGSGGTPRFALTRNPGFTASGGKLRTQLLDDEDKLMTSSASNRNTSNTDHTIVEAGNSHGIACSAALYYPSLIGNSWDDELLPSGD